MTERSIVDLRQELQRSLADSYTLGEELGGGGMARVFVAQDTRLGRRVVVKTLPSYGRSPGHPGSVGRDDDRAVPGG